jgi:hypothetical protein
VLFVGHRLHLPIGGHSLPLPPNAPGWLSAADVRWFRVTTADIIVPVYDD